MERLERFYKIDGPLKGSKIVSFARLREALGLSRAQLRRDLEYMRSRFNVLLQFTAARVESRPKSSIQSAVARPDTSAELGTGATVI